VAIINLGRIMLVGVAVMRVEEITVARNGPHFCKLSFKCRVFDLQLLHSLLMFDLSMDFSALLPVVTNVHTSP